ncbi:MAG: hypothetical protein JRJ60_00490 [Deltaproteobacteria bacterium]|nr:hypothetical protein [Deltaproteobacteria bacterium]
MPSDRFARVGRVFLVCLAVPFLLIVVYIGFVSAVSIWTGLAAIHRNGSWLPIAAGFIAFIAVVWVFFTIVVNALRKEKEDDWVDI